MKLIADKIACHRGLRTIFKDISFSLLGGESLLLRGPNGAGKTTLLRALAGFMPLSAGRWQCANCDDERELPERCHFVGHLNGIKHGLTVFENLRFWQDYLEENRDDALLEQALISLGLASLRDIPAGLMSQGQKRRLGLARLLIAHRPIWILDEPTVSLDVRSTAILAEHIAAHVAKDGIVIAATHIPIGLDFTEILELTPSSVSAVNLDEGTYLDEGT